MWPVLQSEEHLQKKTKKKKKKKRKRKKHKSRVTIESHPHQTTPTNEMPWDCEMVEIGQTINAHSKGWHKIEKMEDILFLM